MNLVKHTVGAALVALLACAAPAAVMAQTPTSMKPIVEDARSHLKAGYQTAGEAASNMALVSHLPSPKGFTNPEYVEGAATQAPAPGQPATARNLGPTGGVFTNSDLAFFKNHVVMGNYHGFNIYDVAVGDKVKLLASVVCPGGQGDVSVYGNLLFMSVEQTRGRLDCGPIGAEGDVNKDRFRGIRIFDISNLANIHQIAAVQTCRGSHTHTLVPDKADPKTLYVYNQGTGAVRPNAELAGCSNAGPEDNATSLFSIDIIKVPLADPTQAKIIASPRIFADVATGALNGLSKGGKQGENGQTTRGTNACHDITVYPAMNVAGGACSGNGILLDISNPAMPKRITAVSDPNFAYWHAAVFSNDAKKVIYTDEWGGGGQPRCRMEDPANWGGDIVFDINAGQMTPRAFYKLPGAQSDKENCVAHNINLIPVPGRDVAVQAWYQGGLSVLDFTDAGHPFEIASFDRGPLDANQMFSGGYWSAYWWNGRIWGSEMARGLDTFALKPSTFLTANEIAAAELVRFEQYNPQTQVPLTWPNKPVVGEAYLDQLARDKALSVAQIAAARKALAAQGSPASVTLAAQFDKDAAKATGKTAERLSGVAKVLRAKA
jgi:hypothetical protein